MKTNHDAPGASGKASSPPPLDSGVIPPSPGRPPVAAVPGGDSLTPLPSVPSIGPLAPTPPPILASLVPGTGGEDLPAISDPTPGNLVQPPSLVDSLAATLPPTSGAPNQSAPHEAAAVDASKPDATVLAEPSVPSTAGPATTPVDVDTAELVAEFGMKWGAVIASTAVNVEEKLPPSVKKKVVDQEPEAGRGKATKDGEEEDEGEKEKLEEQINHHYTKPVKSKAAEKWKRDNMYQTAIAAETVSFSQLVQWKLVFEGYEINYAWPHRFYAPVDEDIESWVGEYRRQSKSLLTAPQGLSEDFIVIDKVMGPDQLAKWEKMENDRLKGLSPAYIQSVIGSRDKRGTATDYDCNKYLLCIALDSLNLDKVETGNFWTRRLKGPSDSTRSEHPALGERFPDLNTQHPFRQLSNDMSRNAFYHVSQQSLIEIYG
jgi:hypothetical protein